MRCAAVESGIFEAAAALQLSCIAQRSVQHELSTQVIAGCAIIARRARAVARRAPPRTDRSCVGHNLAVN